MRIGLDARYVRDSFGGIARFAYGLFSALLDGDRQHQFVIFTESGQRSERFDLEALTSRAAEARRLPMPLYSLQEQFYLPRQLLISGCEAFLSPYFALPLFASVPCYCTVHDLIFERFPAYRSGRWIRYYYGPMLMASLRRSKHVFTVSNSTRRDLVAFYGIDPRRVVVLPEGADSVSAGSAAQAAKPQGEPYFLAVGAGRPHKNLGLAVRALALLRDTLPHRLVVIGKAESRYPDEAMAAVMEQGLQDRVDLLPEASEAELQRLYLGATALLMPSLYEGFGLPALEAMSLGIPVIALDNSSLPEVVGDGGILVNRNDAVEFAAAMLQLAEDVSLRERLQQRAREQAQRFSWKQAAEITVATLTGDS